MSSNGRSGEARLKPGEAVDVVVVVVDVVLVDLVVDLIVDLDLEVVFFFAII